MAFQIVDDILDYCANEAELGKEIGNDFREGKITLPVSLTYPHCSKEEKEFWQRTLIDQNQTPEDLPHALEILQKYEGLTKSYELAAAYGAMARQALGTLPPHPIKDLLCDLIDHCLQRQC